MNNKEVFRLSTQQTIDTSFGEISVPTEVVSMAVGRLPQDLVQPQAFMFVKNCKIAFKGDETIEIIFDYEESEEGGINRKLTYCLFYRGLYVGRFTEHAGSLNPVFKEHVVHTVDGPNAPETMAEGNAHEIQKHLIGIACWKLLMGQVVLSDLKAVAVDNNPRRFLKMLAVRLSYLTGDHPINQQGVHIETQYGPEVVIKRLKMTADGRNVHVVYSTPDWFRHNGKVIDVLGRQSYEQKLDCFVDLYPGHQLLKPTADVVRRDLTMVPLMKNFVQMSIPVDVPKEALGKF